MTRPEALAELAKAEADLEDTRRAVEEAAAPGFIERERALELAARLEAANGRIFTLRGELAKLRD